jgi:hypothetical protein
MLEKTPQSLKHKKQLSAVCFDYRGTLLDHTNDQDIVSGMENLLSELKIKIFQLPLSVVFQKKN